MDLRREVKRGRGLQNVIVVLLIICILALSTVIYIISSKTNNDKPAENIQIGAVINGSIEGFDTTENQNPSEIFQYKLNKSIYLKENATEGEIMLENSLGNTYSMWAEYQIKDTGEVIFTTEKLSPNEHILYEKSTIDMTNGTYDVLVSMMIGDMETGELITIVEENIKIYVGEKPREGN